MSGVEEGPGLHLEQELEVPSQIEPGLFEGHSLRHWRWKSYATGFWIFQVGTGCSTTVTRVESPCRSLTSISTAFSSVLWMGKSVSSNGYQSPAHLSIRDSGRTLGRGPRNITRSTRMSSYEPPEETSRQAPVPLVRCSVLQYPPDLTRLLHNIARDARLAIEETGTNMLYLIFGFLEFYDSAHSDKLLRAPLIAVPVALTKKGVLNGYNTYELTYTGDDIRENLTLAEKLRRDFNLNLPPFDEDKHGEDAEAYLEDVTEVVRNRPRWQVKRQLTMAMLSFGKLALWAELDPQKWPGLLQHPIVKDLFQGNTREFADSLEDASVDDLKDCDELIYDADSSQHNALRNVLSGKTLVINGPPGTGKSQTITNIIASSLVSGKSVLFVAEKLAALEIVKSRLEEAGLGDFCLELHSHKTQKKKLLADIDVRMKGDARVPT